MCSQFKKRTIHRKKSCKDNGFLETSPACKDWELDDRCLPRSVRQFLYVLPELTMLQLRALKYYIQKRPITFIAEGAIKECKHCVGYRKKSTEKNCKQLGHKSSDRCKNWELDITTTNSIFREAFSALTDIPTKGGHWDLVLWLIQKTMRDFNTDYMCGDHIGFVYEELEPANDVYRRFFVRGRIVDIGEQNVLFRTKNGRYFNVLIKHVLKRDQWVVALQEWVA
jgi:hypothetical protein